MFCSCSFLSGFFITWRPWMPRKAIYGLQKAKNTLKCLSRFYEYVTIGFFLGATITFIGYSKRSFSPQRLRNQCHKQTALDYILCLSYLYWAFSFYILKTWVLISHPVFKESNLNIFLPISWNHCFPKDYFLSCFTYLIINY